MMEAGVRTRNQAGFSLIELMITLVVFAVLASVALPTYQDSVRKSGRTAAKGALMDVTMRQEQHFLNNRSYSTDLAGLGLPDPYYVDKTAAAVAASNARRVYRVTLANTGATSYDAVATPQLDQGEDGCGTFTLTAAGVRSVSGALGSDSCW
jgi:type IV pilus assembly protein PilE